MISSANADGSAFVRSNYQKVFDLDLATDLDSATNHVGCCIITCDVDEWHHRFSTAGLQVIPIEDTP